MDWKKIKGKSYDGTNNNIKTILLKELFRNNSSESNDIETCL